MNPNVDKYFSQKAKEIASNKQLLKAFRLSARIDMLDTILNTTHREWETLQQPYMPPRYAVSKSLNKVIDIPRDILSDEETSQIVGDEIVQAFTAEVARVEDNYPNARIWLNMPENQNIREMLNSISSGLCTRLSRQFNWHNMRVAPLSDSPESYDKLLNGIITHYDKALAVVAYQYYLSQFPNLLDRAGIKLPKEFRLSRKLASQSVDTEVVHQVPDNSQIFRAGIFVGGDVLKLPLKAVTAALPKQRFANTIKFTVMDLLRLSVPLGKEFGNTQYVVPIEKLLYQCYPHTMLNPERIRYKGGIFSNYIHVLQKAINRTPITIDDLNKAWPELGEFMKTKARTYREDIIVERYFKPLLEETSENLAQYLAKKMCVQLRKGDNNSANKIRLYTKKEMRGLKNDILFNALELDKMDTVTLYVLGADKETRDQLAKIRAHPNTPLPELSDEPGISYRKITCVRTEARDLCNRVQCLSEPHRESMQIIPLRDIALQGIYTTFDKDNLIQSFGWHHNSEEMEESVSPAVWDVYYHMRAEGALQFPYHHRMGYPGEVYTKYDPKYEEIRKGIPITNTRKPAGSDISTGKYKKSMNPETAGISADQTKYMNNLPYYTVDTLSPEIKELAYKLIACDYLKSKSALLTRENIKKYTDILKSYDPISNTPAIDDQNRKVIIIEGEKKALALKNIADTAYFNALEAYDKTGELPEHAPQQMISLGVGGVWFTKSKSNALNQDMTSAFNPADRTVCLCFDKDSAIKPQVAQAFLRAAHAFKASGAQKVECQLLLGPNQADAHAKGLDDEIAAIYKKNEDLLGKDKREVAIRKSYNEYAEIFERCALPARDDVPYDKEVTVLSEIDKQARLRMKDIGVNPEAGLQYMPEEIQYAYCSSMVPLDILMRHLNNEREIQKQQKVKKDFKDIIMGKDAIPIMDIV